jgi:hypothetical protein
MEDRDCPSTWTDATGDHQFGTAGNWSDGMVPGSPGSGGMAAFNGEIGSDDYCVGMSATLTTFSIASSYTSRITMSGPVTTYMFGMSGGTLDQASGADLTVTGYFNWTGGTINSTSSLANVIIDGATALIAPTGGGTVNLGSNISLENGAVATMNAGTLNLINAGTQVDIKAGTKLQIDAGLNGIVAFATLAGATQVNLKAGGELTVQTGEWTTYAPLKNEGGTFTVSSAAKAGIHGAVAGDAGGRSYVQTSGTTRLYGKAANANSNARLSASEGMLMSGGTLAIVPTEDGITLADATIVLGGMADKTLTIAGGQIIYEDNAIGDTHVFGQLKIVGNVNWTAGTYRPFVSAQVESDTDLWLVQGSFSIGGTAAVDATAVDGENNSVPPPADMFWTFLIGGDGIAGAPSFGAGWTFATSNDNPVTQLKLRAV